MTVNHNSDKPNAQREIMNDSAGNIREEQADRDSVNLPVMVRGLTKRYGSVTAVDRCRGGGVVSRFEIRSEDYPRRPRREGVSAEEQIAGVRNRSKKVFRKINVLGG